MCYADGLPFRLLVSFMLYCLTGDVPFTWKEGFLSILEVLSSRVYVVYDGRHKMKVWAVFYED